MRVLFFLLLLAPVFRIEAQVSSRVYGFTNTPPSVIEQQVRQLVPEAHRVLVNPQVNQVMVIADSDTHERIAQMLNRLDRGVARMRFWFRHNAEETEVEWVDGAVGTLPVSRTPPANLVREARIQLPPGKGDLPPAGSALEIQVSVVRENPGMVRMRVTPALAFGFAPPYEPVRYASLTSDLLIHEGRFADLVTELSQHDFFKSFFSSQPDPAQPAQPVGMLLSLEEIHHRAPTEEIRHVEE